MQDENKENKDEEGKIDNNNVINSQSEVKTTNLEKEKLEKTISEKEKEALKRREERSKTNVYYRAIRNLITKTPIWTKNEMDTALFIVRGFYSAVMGLIFGYMDITTPISWALFTAGFVLIPLYVFPAYLQLNILKIYKTKANLVTTNMFKVYFIFCLFFIMMKIRKLIKS